jgi:hypothetical protein
MQSLRELRKEVNNNLQYSVHISEVKTKVAP